MREINWLSAEQSNSSLIVGDVAMLKMFRRVVGGPHPEAEMGRYLTEQGFANTPPLLGEVVRIDADGTRHALAIAQGFIRNQGDAWTWTLDLLMRGLSRPDRRPKTRRRPKPNSTRTTTRSPRCSAGAWARCMRCWRAIPTIRPSRRRAGDADDASSWATQAEQQLDAAFDALERAAATGTREADAGRSARRDGRARQAADRGAARRLGEGGRRR